MMELSQWYLNAMGATTTNASDVATKITAILTPTATSIFGSII